jgi:hypothetical protein
VQREVHCNALVEVNHQQAGSQLANMLGLEASNELITSMQGGVIGFLTWLLQQGQRSTWEQLASRSKRREWAQLKTATHSSHSREHQESLQNCVSWRYKGTHLSSGNKLVFIFDPDAPIPNQEQQMEQEGQLPGAGVN